MARLATQGLAALAGFWLKILFNLEVYGRERLTGQGCILVPQSWQLPGWLNFGL